MTQRQSRNLLAHRICQYTQTHTYTHTHTEREKETDQHVMTQQHLIHTSLNRTNMPADYRSAAAGLSVDSSSPENRTPSAAAAAASLGLDTRSSSSSSQSPSSNRKKHAPFTDNIDDDEDVAAFDHDDAPPAAAVAQQDHHQPPVPWVRSSSNNNHGAPSATRRLSMPYSHNSRHNSSASRLDLRSQFGALTSTSVKTARNLYRQSTTLYASLTSIQKFLVLSGAVILFALTVTLLVFSHRIFVLLGPVAVSWRALPGGWLIIWALTFFVAFPPLVGYSTACTVAGFVYGFPLGWPIVATATVAGSLAAFVASRTIFSSYVDRLVGQDKRFVALGQVLRHDGLGVLALVRFCPLPYSLSNGFLATVPSIQPMSFAIATAFASPKLLVHVFIGSRLALLAEKGDTMGFGDRVINYVSMLIGGLVGMGVGYFIYRRTMARAAELAREDAERGRPLEGRRSSGGSSRGAFGGPPLREYADEDVVAHGGEDARLMDPNDAAALMVDDDDISLWDAAGDDEHDRFEDDEQGGRGRYRDEEEAVGGNGSKKGDARV